MGSIRRTSQAHLDLVGIWIYAARDSIKGADDLLDRIDRRLKLIAGSPKMGRDREELAAGLRSFPVSRYVIYYRLQQNGIEVIRVLHAVRDIDAIFFKL